MSKMALLSPTKSTLPPKVAFRSAGLLQSPLETTSNQMPRGTSELGYCSKKALSFFLAIPKAGTKYRLSWPKHTELHVKNRTKYEHISCNHGVTKSRNASF